MSAVYWFASHDASGAAVAGAPSLAAGAGGIVAVLSSCLVSGYGSTTLTALSVSAGVATATVQTGHGVLDQQIVEIAGASVGALNGQQRVTRISSTAVQWPTTAADGTASGTITMRLAPAGWDHAFATADNVAVYRPAAGIRPFLRVDDSGAVTFTPTLYSEMMVSGTGDDPVSCTAGTSRHYQSSTAARWYVIADDRWVWLAWLEFDAIGRQAYVLFGAGELSGLEPGDVWGCAIVTNPQSVTALQSIFDSSGVSGNFRAQRLRSRAGMPGVPQPLGVSGFGQAGGYTGSITAQITGTARAAPLLAHSTQGIEGQWPGWYQPLAAPAQLSAAGVPTAGWLGGRTALLLTTYGEGAAAYQAPSLFDLDGPWR